LLLGMSERTTPAGAGEPDGADAADAAGAGRFRQHERGSGAFRTETEQRTNRTCRSERMAVAHLCCT